MNSMRRWESYILVNHYFVNADFLGRNSGRTLQQHIRILYKFCALIPHIYFEQILVCNKDTTTTKPDTDKS